MNKRQIDFTTSHPVPLKPCQPVIINPPKGIDVLTARDVMALLGVGRSTAYTLIAEARARGPNIHRVVAPGCVLKDYFMGQLYGAAPRKENT